MKSFIFLPIVYVYTSIAPKKSARKPTNGRLQRSYSLCAQPLGHVLLGLLPRWQALSQQRLTLLRYFDKMAAPILSGLEPEPALRIHSLNIAADGRLVQLEQLGQLGGPSLSAVCDRHEDRKLAGLQAVITLRIVEFDELGEASFQLSQASSSSRAGCGS